MREATGATRIYEILGFLALAVLVVAGPLYASREAERMAAVQATLEAQHVDDAARLYLESCSLCHGVDGGGLGTMPSLSHPAFAEASYDVLYRTIAQSPHGTVMAAWHVEEGGSMTGYQVESLVTLIQSSQWEVVATLAESADDLLVEPPVPADLSLLEPVEGEDPHECRACHEEPAVHADRFGLNCARCHGLQAWKPALLTRHIFPLDHGDAGRIACKTCHETTYGAYSCYGCHDHTREDVEALHVAEGVLDFADCITCHPSGAPGEALRFEADASSGGMHGE
jgi:mono/diheme cytochrome c family protein